MSQDHILGIDMGGTQIRGGLVHQNELLSIRSHRINASGTTEEVLQEFFKFTDQFINSSVKAIGVGAPGLVDAAQSIIYDVLNIPSWSKVPLKDLIEQRYSIPALINNDANCFALGEFHFGKGVGHDNMIGLTIGTGLGSGIIINKQLYSGKNGGAGEFGMIEYRENFYEYYASGQFFQNIYGESGESVFIKATNGDENAKIKYAEMGLHLGKAIKTILYAYDTDLIVFGGSVSKAYPLFSQSMWDEIKTFAYGNAIKNLRIEISALENSGILGAAALHLNAGIIS